MQPKLKDLYCLFIDSLADVTGIAQNLMDMLLSAR
jgi:hypothetical protein